MLGERERRAKMRASQHPALGRVDEGLKLPLLTKGSPMSSSEADRGRSMEDEAGREKPKRCKSVTRGFGEEDVRGWMSDVSLPRESKDGHGLCIEESRVAARCKFGESDTLHSRDERYMSG